MNPAIARALESYKERLSLRLGPLIQRNFNDFMPLFAAEIMKHSMAKTMVPCRGNHLLYPAGTKFFYRNGTHCQLVIEQKPQVRTIKFLTDEDEKSSFTNLSKSTWRLAFPYVVFVLNFYSCKNKYCIDEPGFAAFANKPLRSLKDKVYSPTLPNIINYEVCSPHDNYTGTIIEQTEQFIANFWQGTFTTDWRDSFDENPIGDLECWEELSCTNPLAVLKTKWKQSSTLFNLIGIATMECDEMFVAATAYTDELLKDAAKKAWHDVTKECTGVETESLDIFLIEEIEKHLANKGSK